MSFYVALLQLRSISSFKQFYTPHLRRARRLTFRERVYKTVNDPRVSPLAFTYAILLILSILVSLVSLLCSTLPENWDTPITNPRWIFAIEVSTTIVFTIDYLVRLCVVPRPYRWIWTAMALVDLFSTITLYVEVILDAAGLKSNIVSLLRVLRAVRIVKLGRFSDSFQVLGRVFRSTIDGFFMMMLLYGLGMVIWGTCLFFAEQTPGGQTFYEPNLTWYREDGTSSPFQSIPECFWWAIVTMTTTGYGDTYPKTPLGKFVTSLCALYGIIMVSFPITIFGNSFAREWKQFEVSRLEDDLQFSDEQELIEHMSRFTRRELVTFARSSMAAHSKNLTQWRSKAAEWSTEREVWDNIILDLREARRKSSLAMEIPL